VSAIQLPQQAPFQKRRHMVWAIPINGCAGDHRERDRSLGSVGDLIQRPQQPGNTMRCSNCGTDNAAGSLVWQPVWDTAQQAIPESAPSKTVPKAGSAHNAERHSTLPRRFVPRLSRARS